MALDRINAVHGINRYLYDKGRDAGIFPYESVYGGRTAFAPVNRIADYSRMTFRDSSGTTRSVPYVVFNWANSSNTGDWYIQEEQVIYLIYSTDMEEMRKMTNFIVDRMKQLDRSATNVQAYLENLPMSNFSGAWRRNPYLDLEYYSISAQGSNGPTPIQEANGRMEGLVTLTVRYAITDDGNTSFDEN